MMDHAITIRDVLYGGGLFVSAIAAAFGLYVLIVWIRMRREYQNALRPDADGEAG